MRKVKTESLTCWTCTLPPFRMEIPSLRVHVTMGPRRPDDEKSCIAWICSTTSTLPHFLVFIPLPSCCIYRWAWVCTGPPRTTGGPPSHTCFIYLPLQHSPFHCTPLRGSSCPKVFVKPLDILVIFLIPAINCFFHCLCFRPGPALSSCKRHSVVFGYIHSCPDSLNLHNLQFLILLTPCYWMNLNINPFKLLAVLHVCIVGPDTNSYFTTYLKEKSPFWADK